MELIDKAAVVTEITENLDFLKRNYPERYYSIETYKELLSFLDTLEVKEVDLEEELKNCLEKESTFINDNREVRYYNGDSFNHIYEIEFIAKHFYELGLKAKGE